MTKILLSILALLLLQAQAARDAAPKVGDEAPNFKAKVIGKEETVDLAAVVKEAKKPAVLIFGSIT